MAENDDTPKPLFEAETLKGYKAAPGQRQRLEAAVAAAMAAGDSAVARAVAEISAPDYPTRSLDTEHEHREPIIRRALAGHLSPQLRKAAERYIDAADNRRAALARGDRHWAERWNAERGEAWAELLAEIRRVNARGTGTKISADRRGKKAKGKDDEVARLVEALPEDDRQNAPAALAALKRDGHKLAGTDGEILKRIRAVLAALRKPRTRAR